VVGYLLGLYVGIYVYDCGRNVGEWYVHRIRGYYVWQVVGYVLLTILIPLAIIYSNMNRN